MLFEMQGALPTTICGLVMDFFGTFENDSGALFGVATFYVY